MDKLEIQIQIKKTIKPSTPTPNSCLTYNTSLFDQRAPLIYTSVLLCYLPSNIELNGKDGVIERCDKLQKSLAKTLTRFYPLAGRYRKDRLSIQCNDEGVEYVETKIDGDLAEFLHPGPKIELLDDLFPFGAQGIHLPSSPLFGVQVNIFSCGGLVLGIEMSHILADAFTAATFINEWARVSQTGTTEVCLSNFGYLSSLYPTRDLPKASLPQTSQNNAKVITRRFVFDALAIAKLKEKIGSSAPLSRVVAIMSLIWKVLVGVSSSKPGRSGASSLILPIALRSKLKEPLIEHALGNFSIGQVANFETNQSRKYELNDFANLLGTTYRKAFLAIDKATSVNDIISMLPDFSKLGQKGEDIYYTTSWCRLPWYDTDFGWGKPFWVSYNTFRADKVVRLIDTKEGDGIEAWLSLEEDDMAEFEKDLDILTFCPPQKRQLIP